MKRKQFLAGLGWAAFFAGVIGLYYLGFLTNNAFLKLPLHSLIRHAVTALLKTVF